MPLDHLDISMVSRAVSVLIVEAGLRPTMVLEWVSMMKYTYATPAQVGTNVKSVTHSGFGAVDENTRFTRSGCLVASGSGLVVFTRLDRLTPSIPEIAWAWLFDPARR